MLGGGRGPLVPGRDGVELPPPPRHREQPVAGRRRAARRVGTREATIWHRGPASIRSVPTASSCACHGQYVCGATMSPAALSVVQDMRDIAHKRREALRTEKARGRCVCAAQASRRRRRCASPSRDVASDRIEILKNGFCHVSVCHNSIHRVPGRPPGTRVVSERAKTRTPGGVWSTSVRIEGSRTSWEPHGPVVAWPFDRFLLAQSDTSLNFPGEAISRRARRFRSAIAHCYPRSGHPNQFLYLLRKLENRQRMQRPTRRAGHQRRIFSFTNVSTGEQVQGEQVLLTLPCAWTIQKQGRFGDPLTTSWTRAPRPSCAPCDQTGVRGAEVQAPGECSGASAGPRASPCAR